VKILTNSVFCLFCIKKCLINIYYLYKNIVTDNYLESVLYMFKQKIKKLLQNTSDFTIGSLWILFSVIIVISILSYNKYDPALNTSTNSAVIHNKLGIMGAYISDFLIQFFGIISIFIAFLFFKLGQRIILGKNRFNPYFKFIMFIFLIISTAALFSIMFPYENYWGLETWGGAIGFYVSQSSGYIPLYILIPSLILIILFSASVVLDIRKRWWLIKTIKTWRIFKTVLCYFYKSVKWILLKILPKKIKEKFVVNKLKYKEEKTEKLKKTELKEYNVKNLKEEGNRMVNEKNLSLLNKNIIYKLPELNLLINQKNIKKIKISKNELLVKAKALSKVMKDFGIKGTIVNAKAGPIITLFEFEPAPGTKSSRVIGLADDIARSMLATSARISRISGKNALGIELPNEKRDVIFLKDMLESEKYNGNKASLPLILGTNIAGEPMVTDLEKMPHLLIAGTTGSGKSVSINTMIMSLLYKLTPDECKMIMIDPKMLELSVYDGIPHLLTPVVTEPEKAILALKWVVREMEDRYRTMAALGVRGIKGYNEKLQKAVKSGKNLSRKIQVGFNLETGEPLYEYKQLENKPMPYIVVVVDEMADLMITSGKEIESSIQRLAQMARAAGIHIIMATQRPSVDVITGVIKANFPTRISFQVTSKIDSRTILGEQGGEQLLGMGDMLFMPGGSQLIRAHGPFVSDDEIEDIIAYIKSQGFEPEYMDEVLVDQEGDASNGDGGFDYYNNRGSGQHSGSGNKISDKELYEMAIEIVKKENKCSISYIQRQLRIGYNKAANIVEKMERDGVLSAPGRTGRRQILIKDKNN
jgi:DNA segregation ATPase FtsK/SpoIIIE, S-DNA-T family